ncbi:MAG: methylated-DNA--[protein]-cysteine S-methyltransferase [Myxococcales bacterium]|nr:methylated-DNA--[protein]-cysteine S-methyltransferase [Myxococcales bacterium]
MTYFQKKLSAPFGQLRCVSTSEALVAVSSRPESDQWEAAAVVTEHPILDQAVRELVAYFDGEAQSFATPIEMGGTDFQNAVWCELLKIPFGESRSYADIAKAIGKPKAVRAVGAANGKNPLGILVPCHRVIGKNGSLTGYGGGLEMKLWLLRHEGALLV